MLRVSVFFLIAAACFAAPRAKTQGDCQQGNGTVTVSGITSSSSTLVQRSFPSCTVTVYLAGTTTIASLYSDDAGTAKGNPFTSASDGAWFFYANDGRYDVRLSAGGIPTPFTRGDAQALDWRILHAGTGGVARPMKDKINEMANVTDFGVIGDGSADDTTAMQNAANASKQLWIPCGLTIKTVGSISITKDHQIAGCSTASIVNATTNPVLDLQQPGDGVVYNSSFSLSGFQIVALNALRVGNPDWSGPQINASSTVMNGSVSEMVFTGPAAWDGDPNVGTATYPTLTTLRSYGVCVSFTLAYKFFVHNNVFEGCGIGILHAGDDQMEYVYNRFHNSGRNIHLKNLPLGSGFTSGFAHITNNDLGASALNGSIYIDTVSASLIQANFMECTTDACTFIYSNLDGATMVELNQFIVGNASTTTSILDIGAYQIFTVNNNTFASAGSPMNVSVRNTNYGISFPVLAIFKNNQGLIPPKVAHVLDDSSSDQVFSANSTPDWHTGKIPYGPMFNAPSPWAFNSTVGGYVLARDGVQANVSFPVNGRARRWYLKISAMATAGGGDVTYTAYYVSGGVRNKVLGTVPSAYPSFPLLTTRLTAAESLTFTVPDGYSGIGLIEVDFSTSSAVVYSIELVTVPEERERVNVISRAATPSLGTYQIGDVVLNTATGSGVNPAWICTTAGTINSIGSGVTGAISNGFTTLTLTTGGGDPAALLAVNEYITIAGVTGVKRIVSLVGAVATLDSASNATVSGAVVSHSLAVFTVLPPLVTTVTAPATLTNTAIMTGGTGAISQTPSATATLSSGGSMSLPGALTVTGTITGPQAATNKFATLIPIFANNAAAIAGGLVAGQLYRTGANPDPVYIVH